MKLNTASKSLRKAAAAAGIKSGQWEPIFSRTRGMFIELPDDTPVARVWNSRREVIITAGDVRYAQEYL